MTWFDVNFGANKAGLATVGYREVNNVGGDAVARTTVGVVDAGNGMYGVDVTLNANTVSLQWDTGEAVPIYAVESINQIAGLDAKIDIIDANVDQALLDIAAVDAQNVLILSDTNQILLDSTQLLLDTAALSAQNVLILADTNAILLDTSAIDALLSDIEDGRDIREILRLIVASAANKLSGAETTQITFTKLDGTGARQVTDVDSNGNRTNIVSRDFT